MKKAFEIAFGVALAAGVGAGPARGADDHAAAVKGVYLDRERHPSTNGLRFDIEVERPDGTRTEVPVSARLRSGDRFRLRMDVRNPVYVYVLNRTLPGPDKGIVLLREDDARRPPAESGAPRLVFGPEMLGRGTSRLVPKAGSMRLDDATGVEKLYVVLSPKPLHIETLFDPSGRLIADSAGSGAIQDLDQQLAGWAENADAAIPSPEGPKGVYLDTNGYCVERRPNEALMLELTLRHTR